MRRVEEERTKASSGGAVRRPARFRQVLEQKANEVRALLSAKRAAEVVHRLEEPQDYGDWCQKSHEEWLFVNQNRLEIELLHELDAALRRLAHGDYGVCQECNEPISPRRLEALPWARLCVRCQEKTAPTAPAPPERNLLK